MLQRLTIPNIFLILSLIVSMSVSGVAEANNAPTASGTIPAQTVNIGGTAATVDVSSYFSDSDGDTLTYTATSSDTAKATVSVSSATVTITAVAAGTATITVTATDPGGLSVNQTISVTVVQPNRAPTTVGTIPNQVLAFGGSAVTFNAKQYFSDPDGDALTFHSIYHSNDAAISITGYGNWDVKITPKAAGSATVTIVVRDPSNLEASQSFNVKVNKGPVANGTIPNGTAAIGVDTYAVDLNSYFTDANNDTLTYTFEADWSTPDTIATVALSGSTLTVTPVSVGTVTITVTATDPQNQTATQTYSVSVTQPNRAPTAVGTIPDQKLKIATNKSPSESPDTISLGQYFNDEDGDTLTYVTTATNQSIVLPHAGAPGEVTLNGLAVGSTSVTITARDPDGLTATQTFNVKVYNGPETVGTISDVTLDSGGNTHTVDLSTYFDAIDTSTLTYTVISSNTSFATVSLSGTTLTVTTAAVGTVTVTATATDSDGLTATQTFTVTVEQANRAPVTVGTIPDQTVYINGSSVTIDTSQYFFDADGDKLWYTGLLYDNGTPPTRVVVELNSSGVVTISAPNPNLQNPGTARSVIYASDGQVRVEQEINITVLPEVKPPVASGTIPDVTLVVAGTSDVDVSGYFSGVSSDILTYSVVSSDTSKATTSLSGKTLTVTAVAHGTATITVTATNPISESATQSFTVTVTNPSSPVAVGTIPDSTDKKAGHSAYQVQLSGYFSDPNSALLLYTATSSDSSVASVSVTATTSGLTVTGAILSVTPLAQGTATITVTATNPQVLSATQSFTMTVRQANRAPVGTTIPNISKSTNLYVDIPLAGYFSDPDGDALSYSVAITASPSLPYSWRVGPSTLTILSSTATQVATITVTATDTDSATDSETFTVTISRPPYTVGSIPSQDVVINKSITLENIDSYFADPDGDPLTYSLVNSWSNRISASLSGTTVTITGKTLGTASLRVRAVDMVGGSIAYHDVSVTVSSPQPPTAVGTIPAIEGPVNQAGTTIALSGYFSDPAGQTLTYSASVSDSYYVSVSINSSNELEVNPQAAGTATITVTATNPDKLSATQSISVKLTESVFHGEADAVAGLSSAEQLLLGQLLTYDTLIFNELHNGADDSTDWLELRNVSNVDIPIDNWQLRVQTGSDTVSIRFPAGTVIHTGQVLLLTNTEMPIVDASILSVVAEDFVLPQTEFALILRSPTAFGDLAGNYFQGQKERPETAPAFTEGTVWDRVQVTTSGYRAEAWAVSTHRNGLGSPGYQPSTVAGDLNNDGLVNILDLVLVASQFGTKGITAADLNGDMTVNIQDLVLVANAFSNVGAAPTAKKSAAATVNNWLQLAQQHESKVVKTAIPKGFSYTRGIAVLEQLARALTPNKTALLANYPNPFNPETWIPYQLSKAADVTVTIYASDGNVIRTLALGHRDVGTYKNRSRAAYWDGKNETGESVASGVYFYTLTAGNFSATRKMLILK